MGIKLAVALADTDWFEMLRQRSDLDEINFWSPSANHFHALQPGELLLFKRHAPCKMIVGCGVFTYANVLPCWLAWDTFGEANGAHSERELREHIIQYRTKHKNSTPDGRSDFDFGCRILTYPFFFDEDDWMPPPRDWPRRSVPLKTYDTDGTEGRALWDAVRERMMRQPVFGIEGDLARFGAPQLFRPRRGQGAFRLRVTKNYKGRCAVTRERTLPALEAAHIYPYKQGGTHKEQNGMLLRRDIHKLFDDGYVTVTPELRFRVSDAIKEEFENGHAYYERQDTKIIVPRNASLRPDPDALDWHNKHCFKG